MDVSTLEAGEELDRRVAEIIGIQPHGNGLLGYYWAEDGGRAITFEPSIDWSDAMLAAERFGLFKPGMFLTQMTDGCGLICGGKAFKAETFPLAISRAICKLAEERK